MTFIENFFNITGEKTNKYLIRRKNRGKDFANEDYKIRSDEAENEVLQNCILSVLIKDSRTADEFQNNFIISSIKVDKFKKEIFVNLDLIINVIEDIKLKNFKQIMDFQPLDIFSYSQIKSLKKGTFTSSEKDRFCETYTVFIKIKFNRNDPFSSFDIVNDFSMSMNRKLSKATIVINNGVIINGSNPIFKEFDLHIDKLQKIIHTELINFDKDLPLFEHQENFNDSGVMSQLDKFQPELLEKFCIDEELLNFDDSGIIWKSNKSHDCYFKSET